MNTLKRSPVSELLGLEPKLQKFSERQVEVAQTWAMHFKLAPAILTPFITHYLNSTSHTRCWCVPLGDIDQYPQPVLARMGDRLQYFDGQTIRAYKIYPRDRVQKKKPSAPVARKLLLKFEQRWSKDPLLTSFCKSAREVAKSLTIDDLGKFCHPDSSSMLSNNRYFNPRTRFYLTQIGSTLKQFCQCLDQGLLFAIRSVQCPSPTLYNWLAQGDRQRRLQALKAQPVLVPLLVIGHEWPWPWDAQQQVYRNSPWDELQRWKPIYIEDEYMSPTNDCLIGHIVDSGLPLIDTLAWLLQAPRMSIRYVGQQRVFDTSSALSHIAREGPDRGWNALLVGASLGNRRPSTKMHWKSFFATLEKIPQQLRQQATDLNTLFSGCPTNWSDPGWPKIAAKLQDLREVFNNLDHDTDPLVHQALQRVKHFISAASYHQIANLVDAFHQALIDIRITLDESDPQAKTDSLTCWPALLSNDTPIACPNGLHIIELKCPADLDAEHRALGHCIQSYDYSAYRGDCRLVSVRLDGQSLASAELQLPDTGNGEISTKLTPRYLETIQLRGRGNQIPRSGSRVERAYQWFWSQVQTGEIQVNLEWPDMTHAMPRYTRRNRKSLHAMACAEWINLRLSRK